ncbi:MAG: 16S rRNA (adenine(1518)-N(6)/adenine(1519)-N(6))-dimethyltransferase RsmA [Actinobacteria bacterium]|nr:16S rRNA (adenine(1518)-N(6)/adenine(1519)-N(6))-dimethyltransferase RsmA [Actinomycetota bacterium]
MSEGGLGRRAVRDLAARHGIHPTKALGQHFLVDPNLARAIVAAVGAGPGDRVLEVGPGLGSLTVALAAAGARVLAVELDRALEPALREAVAGLTVEVVVADALRVDWPDVLGEGPWKMASNLPYNVAVPLLVGMLDAGLPIERYVVMVQREVGERLAAGPGQEAYGAASVRVAYRAGARVLRRVAPTVFWPRPAVDSVLVELTPREPPVAVEKARLDRVIREGFAERRKTMRNALVRLGLEAGEAEALLSRCGVDPRARAEQLGLPELACLAEGLPS